MPALSTILRASGLGASESGTFAPCAVPIQPALAMSVAEGVVVSRLPLGREPGNHVGPLDGSRSSREKLECKKGVCDEKNGS